MVRLRLRLKGHSLPGIPTLSNFSALGAAPLVLQGSTTDYVAGYRGQLQIATDSGFSTITQNLIFFIDGASWASNSITTGLATPGGLYFSRWRELRDNENGTLVTGNDPLGNALSFNADVSAWSNTFTDTITASVAALSTGAGTVNKSHLLTVTGSPPLSFAGANGTGGYQPDRSTIVTANDYSQFEVTITTAPAGVSQVGIGYCNNTDNLDVSGGPGTNTSNGVIVKLRADAVFINWNSDGSGTTLSSVVGVTAVGDVFALRRKASTNAVEVWRTRSGTTTQIGTTQTVAGLSGWAYFFVAPLNNEAGTVNAGASAYSKALDLGCAIFG